MDGEFNVFDEWGNYVGKFTPAGAGCADSIFLVIAMLILWTVGFLIFLFIKLIVKGFRAAKEGDWENALMYWLVPGLLAFFFMASLISGAAAVAAEERQQRIEEARWVEITGPFEQISAQASRIDLEKDLWLLTNNPGEVFSARRIEGSQYTDKSCGEEACEIYGKYEVANLSRFSTMEISSGCRVETDIYNSELYGPDHLLYPGGTRIINCLEYYLDNSWWGNWMNWYGEITGSIWREQEICITVSFENPIGESYTNECFELPLRDLRLSDKVRFSVERIPTRSVDYSGLLKLTIEIDQTVPYTVAIRKITSEPQAHYENFHGLYQENEDDRRLLDFSSSGFSPGQIYERYIYLYGGFDPKQFCFELSVAYTQNEIVCVNVP